MASVVFTIGSVVMAVSPEKWVSESGMKWIDKEILTGAACGQDCCGDGHRDGEHVHPCLHGRDQPGGAEGLLGCIFPGYTARFFFLRVSLQVMICFGQVVAAIVDAAFGEVSTDHTNS